MQLTDARKTNYGTRECCKNALDGCATTSWSVRAGLDYTLVDGRWAWWSGHTPPPGGT